MSSLLPLTAEGASSGAELVTGDGRSLALVSARLIGEMAGGLARLVLEQRFENAYDENLRVTYRMPLPADGAVSGYEFVIGERTVKGSIDRKVRARERFEQAIASGKTAALLEQERADIFTQQIGNIGARESVVARITIDQRLVWLPEGEWELRFPTVIGPRYIGSADTAADVRATHIKVTQEPLRAGIQIALAVKDTIVGGGNPTSPSHHVERGAGGTISLHSTTRLDRDIVVRWRVATPTVGISLAAARPQGPGGHDAFGLLTIVPPARDAKPIAVPRDLIVLLDTSGSMDGGPLEKAKQVIGMMIDSLDEQDRFELIEFSNEPRRYLEEPVIATARAKQAALKWLRSRQADGATEMRAAVIEALTTLRVGAQRQVVVVTDGYVGGEKQILEALNRRLPKSCRLHVLGVGSAVNRSLATSLSRAGRGVEVLVGIDEDAERGAKRLLDRTRMPVLTNVEISGSALLRHAPALIPDVFEGAPLVAALALRADGGELVVRGQLAREPWEQTLRVPAQESGAGNQAIVALYGRERVADVEATALFSSVDGEVEELGMMFKIATRMTSWVAIDESRTVTGPSYDQLIPQELPYGTSASAFGLRSSGAVPVALLGVTRAGTVARAMESLPMAAPSAPRSMASTPPPAMAPSSGSVRSLSVDSSAAYSGGHDAKYEADESYDDAGAPGDFSEEAPRESFGDDDDIDPAASDIRLDAYADDASASSVTRSVDDIDAFLAEEPTGVRKRAAAPAPAPAAKPKGMASAPPVARAMMVVRKSAAPAQPEPQPQESFGVMNAMQQSPPVEAGKAAEPARPLAPLTKSRFAIAVWAVIVLALLALLLWWLVA